MTKPLSRSQIAKAWGTHPTYVSKVKSNCRRMGEHMPAFKTQKEARDWYDGRKQRSSGENYGSTVEQGSSSSAGSASESISVDALLAKTAVADFDAEMIKHAEQVPLVAYHLYLQAAAEKKDALLSVRIKNWAEAAKHGAAIRKEFLSIQEKAGLLLPMDVILDVYDTQVQALVNAVDSMGRKYGKRANPDNPELAQRVLDEVADKLKLRVLESRSRIEGEMVGRQEAIDLKTKEAVHA